MTNDKVVATVIIAAWCAEAWLAKSVRGALAQNVSGLEVIVVDDASTDGTWRVARGLATADSRVRTVSLDRNGGPARARNVAIEMARGEWIAVLDSDDDMRPGRLHSLIGTAERLKADCIYDDLVPVAPDGRLLGASHLADMGIHEPEQWTLERFLSGCRARPGQPALGYLKPVIRRRFLDRTGLRYDQSLHNGEDFHLVAELLAQGGNLWFVPEAGYFYTQRDASVSRRLDPTHGRALMVADQSFRKRHADSLTPEVKRILRERTRNLADMLAMEVAARDMRSGRLGHAAVTLSMRPAAAVRLGGLMLRKMWQRKAV